VKFYVAKAHSYLVDAMTRIQKHLGTLGNTPIAQAEASWLAVQLTALRAVQQAYQKHLAAQGPVVP
jgi:ABC-type phosphate/phosphonate transport system substrate-binding protein